MFLHARIARALLAGPPEGAGLAANVDGPLPLVPHRACARPRRAAASQMAELLGSPSPGRLVLWGRVGCKAFWPAASEGEAAAAAGARARLRAAARRSPWGAGASGLQGRC
jgi:hypothetical protein